MDDRGDGGVEQEGLGGRQAGVGDCPAQVAAVDVLGYAPPRIHIIHPYAPVPLVRSCMDTECVLSVLKSLVLMSGASVTYVEKECAMRPKDV